MGSLLHWLGHEIAAPAIVAVAFAGTTTFLIERFGAVRDEVTNLSNSVRDDLRSVQNLAVEYWSRDRLPEDRSIEAKIVAGQTDLAHSVRLLNEFIDLGGSSPVDHRLADLFDALTGGSFQEAARVADPPRIQALTRMIARFRSDIGRARMRSLVVFGLGHRHVSQVKGPSSAKVDNKL
jgi:hypothetical protein